MSRFAIKGALLAFAIIGFATFASGGKVSALSCPGGLTGSTPDPNYGYTAGEAADGFAGAVVSSFYGSGNGWGDSRNGSRLDQAKYYLQSYVPNAPFGTQYNLSGHPQSDRIFSVDSGNNTTGRTSGRWFGTGGATGDALYANAGDGGYTCPGWDAIGPGRVFSNITPGGVINYEEAGNRHALDCGESYYAPGNPNSLGKTPTQFWIGQIPKPNGESGHWQVQIFGASNNGYINIDNINANPMGPGGNVFTVNNGATVKINLIWHADKPNEQKLPTGGQCNFLDVANNKSGNSNRRRVYVEVTGISLGRQRNNNDPSTDNTWSPGNPSAPDRPRSIAAWVGGSPGENGLGPSDSPQSKQWWFTPWDSNSIHVKITVQDYWDNDGNGSKTWNTIGGYPQYLTDGGWSTSDGSLTCYSIGPPSGQCQVLSISGDGPGGSISTPGNVYFAVRITNSSRDGLQLWNPALSVNGATYGSNDILEPGQSHDFYGSFGAPGWSHGLTTFNFTAKYFGDLGSCSWTGPIYQYFQIQPRANIAAIDKENPTTVTYTSGGRLLTGPSFPVVTYSALTKSGGGCPSATDSHATVDTYGDYDRTYVYNNPCINAGDTFCAYTTISPASGWHGPDGYANLSPADATAGSACAKTVNEPYAHFQGSDVSAGGGFGQTCTQTQTGSISTYSKATGSVAVGGNGGSGAQFGAQAMSVISGLTSASLRSSDPTGLSGLTFANNDGHIGGSVPNRTNGGFLGGGTNFCVPDYFSDKPESLTTPSIATTAAAGGGATQQYYKPNGGMLTLSGGTVPNSTNQSIFVEGDVTITGNIQYDAAARTSIKSIPSFYLVVKGNIRIAPGVTRLDGVYVAQPKSNTPPITSGIINSCWQADPNQIYNNCKNQLTVNGAFVANKVLLTRSYSSLRYSQNGEHNLGTYPAHNCGNVGKDVPATGPVTAADCAAEIFNFNPELYMSQPGIKPSYGATSGKYDAITSLSPVL